MCDTGSPIVATVLNQPAHRYNSSKNWLGHGVQALQPLSALIRAILGGLIFQISAINEVSLNLKTIRDGDLKL
jgi:hypothetical protein